MHGGETSIDYGNEAHACTLGKISRKVSGLKDLPHVVNMYFTLYQSLSSWNNSYLIKGGVLIIISSLDQR